MMLDITAHHVKVGILATIVDPIHRPKRSEMDTFSSTASDGLTAVVERVLQHLACHQVTGLAHSLGVSERY